MVRSVRFLLILFGLMTLCNWAYTQDDLVLSNCPEGFIPNRERDVVKLTENMPSWIGCEIHDWPATREDCTRDSVAAFVKKNLVYPQDAIDMGLEGQVWIKFIVEDNGCLSNIAISRTLGGHTGWESQKLVRSMPKWNPATEDGRFLPVQLSIPITYKLSP